MNYRQQDVLSAFRLYTKLAQEGQLTGEEVEKYVMNDDLRGLLDQFANEVDCIIVHAVDIIYLVPHTTLSTFHLKNEAIRKELGSTINNTDLYTMYLAILVFIGEFYDSFESTEIQRDFLTITEWLDSVHQRIEELKTYGAENFKKDEQDFEYNWLAIIENWEALNDLKESASKQKGRTLSRLSFLNKVIGFMLNHKLINQIGEDEYELTEKTQVIVQRYFMELDYNRGILQFMYKFEEQKGAEHAINS